MRLYTRFLLAGMAICCGAVSPVGALPTRTEPPLLLGSISDPALPPAPAPAPAAAAAPLSSREPPPPAVALHHPMEEFFMWMPSGDRALEEWGGDGVLWLLTTTVTRTQLVPSTVLVTREVQTTPVERGPAATPRLDPTRHTGAADSGGPHFTAGWSGEHSGAEGGEEDSGAEGGGEDSSVVMTRTSIEYPGPSATVSGPTDTPVAASRTMWLWQGKWVTVSPTATPTATVSPTPTPTATVFTPPRTALPSGGDGSRSDSSGGGGTSNGQEVTSNHPAASDDVDTTVYSSTPDSDDADSPTSQLPPGALDNRTSLTTQSPSVTPSPVTTSSNTGRPLPASLTSPPGAAPSRETADAVDGTAEVSSTTDSPVGAAASAATESAGSGWPVPGGTATTGIDSHGNGTALSMAESTTQEGGSVWRENGGTRDVRTTEVGVTSGTDTAEGGVTGDTGTTEVGVTGDTGTTEVGVTGGTGTTEVGVTGNTGSTEYEVTYDTGTKEYGVTYESGTTEYGVPVDSGTTEYGVTDDNGTTEYEATDVTGTTHGEVTSDTGTTEYVAAVDNGTTEYDVTDASGTTEPGVTYVNDTTKYEVTDVIGTTEYGVIDVNGTTEYGVTDDNGTTEYGVTDVNGTPEYGVTDVNSTTEYGVTDVTGTTEPGVTDASGTTEYGVTDANDTTERGVTDTTGTTEYKVADNTGTTEYNVTNDNDTTEYGDPDVTGTTEPGVTDASDTTEYGVTDANDTTEPAVTEYGVADGINTTEYNITYDAGTTEHRVVDGTGTTEYDVTYDDGTTEHGVNGDGAKITEPGLSADSGTTETVIKDEQEISEQGFTVDNSILESEVTDDATTIEIEFTTDISTTESGTTNASIDNEHNGESTSNGRSSSSDGVTTEPGVAPDSVITEPEVASDSVTTEPGVTSDSVTEGFGVTDMEASSMTGVAEDSASLDSRLSTTAETRGATATDAYGTTERELGGANSTTYDYDSTDDYYDYNSTGGETTESDGMTNFASTEEPNGWSVEPGEDTNTSNFTEGSLTDPFTEVADSTADYALSTGSTSSTVAGLSEPTEAVSAPDPDSQLAGSDQPPQVTEATSVTSVTPPAASDPTAPPSSGSTSAQPTPGGAGDGSEVGTIGWSTVPDAPSLTPTASEDVIGPSLTSTASEGVTGPSLTSTAPEDVTGPSLTSTAPEDVTGPSLTSTAPEGATGPSLTSTAPEDVTEPSLRSTAPGGVTGPDGVTPAAGEASTRSGRAELTPSQTPETTAGAWPAGSESGETPTDGDVATSAGGPEETTSELPGSAANTDTPRTTPPSEVMTSPTEVTTNATSPVLGGTPGIGETDDEGDDGITVSVSTEDSPLSVPSNTAASGGDDVTIVAPAGGENRDDVTPGLSPPSGDERRTPASEGDQVGSSETALTDLFDVFTIEPGDIGPGKGVASSTPATPVLESSTLEIQHVRSSEPSLVSFSTPTPASTRSPLPTSITPPSTSSSPPNSILPVSTLSPAPSASRFYSDSPTGAGNDDEATSTEDPFDLTTGTEDDGMHGIAESPVTDNIDTTSSLVTTEITTLSQSPEENPTPSDASPQEEDPSGTTTPPGDTSATCPPCQRAAAAGSATVAPPAAGKPGAQVANGTYKRSVPEPEYWIVTVLKFAPEHVDEAFVRDVEARLSKAFNDAYEQLRKRSRGRREAPAWPRWGRGETARAQVSSDGGQHSMQLVFRRPQQRLHRRGGLTLPPRHQTQPVSSARQTPPQLSPLEASPDSVTTATLPRPSPIKTATAAQHTSLDFPLTRLTSLLRPRAGRVRRAQDGHGPVQVYVHNVDAREDNRTRLLYTAWRDGEPLDAVQAVAVVSDAIDDKEMSVRMGHVVEVTKEYLQPPLAEARPPWLLVVLLLLLLILLLLLCWLCCYCWKRQQRRAKDDTDAAGTDNRRRVFEEEGRENKGFVGGEPENKPGGSGAAPQATTAAASCQTSPEEGNTPATERLIRVKAGHGPGAGHDSAARRKYVLEESDESEPDDSMYASLGLRTSVTARHGSDRSLTPINEPAVAPPPPPPLPLPLPPASRPSSATVAVAAPAAAPPTPAARRVRSGRRPASAGRPASAAQREVTPYRSTYPLGGDEASRLFTSRVPARALPLPFEAYRPESPAPSVPPRRYRDDPRQRRDRRGRHGDDLQVRVETETVEIVSGSGSESDGSTEPLRGRPGASSQEAPADIGRMRRRFHTLLDDAFNSLDGESRGGRWRCRSAAPSRNRWSDGPELAASPPRRPASALERRSVPTQVSLSPGSPGHKAAWTTTEDLYRSAAAAGPPPIRLLPGRTGVESTPMPRRVLSPLEPTVALAADDPAVPLIRAIQAELKRFGQTVPTDDTDV